MERRREYRLPFDCKVIHSDGKTSKTAYAINISRGGLFLLTMDSLPLGTIATLCFLLPNQPNTLCLKAKVAHVVCDRSRADVECGIGFEFLSITKEQKIALNLYLLNSKASYLELKKLLEPKIPDMVEIGRQIKSLPGLRHDLLYLRYRINRICSLFEVDPTTLEIPVRSAS